MIIFEKITWKNLLSYGNNTTEFVFNSGIYKISAINGSGKSSLIDAFYFALFGKPYRKIKLNQLINSKNKKGLEVVLHFTKQDDKYRIERGLKPDYFKIFKNDEIFPVSSSKKGYQQILEDDILGSYNENLANQVSIKSMTKNASFMTLDKANKKAIIENLFDIEMFTVISKLAKAKIDELETELSSTKKDLENTTLLIEQEIHNIEKLRNLQAKLQEESDSIIKGYEDEINELNAKNVKLNEGLKLITKYKTKQSELNKKINELRLNKESFQREITSLETLIKASESKTNFLSKTCGECPKIKELMANDGIEDKQKTIENLKEKIKQEINSLTTLESELKKANEILYNETNVVNSIKSNNERIEKLTNQISNISN